MTETSAFRSWSLILVRDSRKTSASSLSQVSKHTPSLRRSPISHQEYGLPSTGQGKIVIEVPFNIICPHTDFRHADRKQGFSAGFGYQFSRQCLANSGWPCSVVSIVSPPNVLAGEVSLTVEQKHESVAFAFY